MTGISLIPQAKNKEVLSYKDCTTRDIIQEVLLCYRNSKDQLKEFAETLQHGSIYETCKACWDFVKDNITYLEDPAGWQFVKTPAATWKDGFCDCKGYSIFLASLLYNLGINFTFRFACYDNSNIPTHVYIVVLNNGKEIYLDCVANKFDKQERFTYKKDFPMTGVNIVRVSGLKQARTRAARIGDFWSDLTDFSDTVHDVVNDAAGVYTTVNNAINPTSGGIHYSGGVYPGAIIPTTPQVAVQKDNTLLYVGLGLLAVMALKK